MHALLRPRTSRLSNGRRCLALLALLTALGGCGGEHFRREGINLILEGKLDQGLAKLEAGVKADPKNALLRAEYLRQRDHVLGRLLNQARSARAQGDLGQAEEHYYHILALDPGNAAARDGLAGLGTDRRHAKLLAEVEGQLKRGDLAGARDLLRIVLVERPDDPKANQLRYRLEEKSLRESLAGPTLNIKGRRPVTLQFRDANLKMVLEAISRATGVNILVDKDVRNDIKVTIFVRDAPVEETLDLILLQNQLEKRVLSENSVLVYPMTAAKVRDYQELKIRRFVLINADPKQAMNMLKTVLRTKDIHVDEKTHSLIVRDSNQAIRLAEKLIASIDQPEPEVMLEVQLLDLDRKKTLELGIDWPNKVSWIYPLNGKPLRELRQMQRGDANVTFGPNLGVTLRALETDGDTRVLATPRIRTRSNEKAKIMIGNRTPIISSAAVPSTAVGATPVYNTNIQYLDTGIKLEVEPEVHLDGEVAIRINLEVSDLGAKFENQTTGTLAYATTTNNASTTLRLKDGETQVLAGLIRAFSSNSGNNKVPGLGDIPLIGRLFGIQSDNWENRELVLAITPHIVRNNQSSEADLLEFWSGTESSIRFDTYQKAPVKMAAAIASPVQADRRSGQEGKSPGTGMPVEAGQESDVPVASDSPVPVLTPQLVGATQAKKGETITVAVHLPSTGAGLESLDFSLKYDTDKLQPVEIAEGDLVSRYNGKATFQGDIDRSAGVIAGNLQIEDSGLAVESGNVGIAQFKVLAPGVTAITVVSFSAVGGNKKSYRVFSPQPLQVSLTEAQ